MTEFEACSYMSEAVADSLNDFCYEQSFAEHYLRSKLPPEEQKARKREDMAASFVALIGYAAFILSILYYL